MEKLLKVRKTIKSKKPEFLQQDHHKKARLSRKWKRPTGLQSKMRHQFKGYSRRVKQGWRSPVEIRGFHISGLEPVLVYTVEDLSQIQKGQGALIAANVGARKKLLLLEKALSMKITVINLKLDAFKKKLELAKAKIVEDKKEKTEKKKKTLEDSLKKAEKKKEEKQKIEKAQSAEESEKAEEEKKEEEKKEKDDVLIHKQ